MLSGRHILPKRCPPDHCPKAMYEPASHQVGWVFHSLCEFQSVQQIIITLSAQKAKLICVEMPNSIVHGHLAQVKDPGFSIALMIVQYNVRNQSNRGKALLLTML